MALACAGVDVFFFNFRLCRARSAASPVFQEMVIKGFPLLYLLPIWPGRTCTNVIVVYIPQLTTPDPRSIAKSLRVRAYQVRDLQTIHNGSGISSGCITSRTSMLVQREFLPRQLL